MTPEQPDANPAAPGREAEAAAGSGGDLASAEALADFLRRVRHGIEDGLDPLHAAERAGAGLPGRLGDAVLTLIDRMRGDYSEDEWGFDEGFAEAVYPFAELLYGIWWRVAWSSSR